MRGYFHYLDLGKSEQTVRHFCRDLDLRTLQVQNYIDFNNPNYLPLNYGSERDNEGYTKKTFYSDEQLENLGILVYNNAELIGINIDKIRPHQILYNNYGKNLTIFLNENSFNDSSEKDILLPGFALVKKFNNQYLTLSEGTSGDYYVVTKIDLTNGKMTFTITANASSIYGTNTLLSVVHNARWFWREPYLSYSNKDISLANYAFNNQNNIQANIITKGKTIWDSNNYTLSYEVYQEKEGHYEEIINDSFSNVTTSVDNNGYNFSQFNIQDLPTNLGFYINLY